MHTSVGCLVTIVVAFIHSKEESVVSRSVIVVVDDERVCHNK